MELIPFIFKGTLFFFLFFSGIIIISYYWPRNYTNYINYILFQAALAEISRGLSYNEVYTRKGLLRAHIQKRAKNLVTADRPFYNANRTSFMHFLKNRNLLSAQNKIQKRNLNKIVTSYLAFKELYYKQNMVAFTEHGITPDYFFQIRKQADGDIVGVYVIFNETKQMYYVGQAKRMFFRVNQHFTGHGNGDVYSDYLLGDSFKIQLVNLADSGYTDIDKLEKDLINKYHAYTSGYNRTRGNG